MGQKDLDAIAKADVNFATKIVSDATKQCAFDCESIPLCPLSPTVA